MGFLAEHKTFRAALLCLLGCLPASSMQPDDAIVIQRFEVETEREAPPRRVPVGMNIPDGWQVRALRARAALPVAAEVKLRTWRSLGPTDYAFTGGAASVDQGRATASWTDPRPGRAGHLLAGFAGGGVWETLDAGGHWRPLIDDQPTLAVGSLAVDAERGTIYVGTGEANYTGRREPWPQSIGILKSTDWGRTWQLELLPWPASVPVAIRAVGRMAIDPRDSQTVYAATSVGLMRTHDGGATWAPVASGGLPFTGDPRSCAPDVNVDATDLVIDARVATHGGPAPIFVAIAQPFASGECVPDFATRALNGVYRSLDGGASWTQIATMGSGPFPPLAACSGFGRITLALGGPQGGGSLSALYALVGQPVEGNCAVPLTGYTGTFRSLDANAAATWTLQSAQNAFCRFRCHTTMAGAVDPDDVDALTVGGLDLWASTDGGRTLAPVASLAPIGVPYIHADIRALTAPAPGAVLASTDGGVYRIRTRHGKTSVESLNRGDLSTMQFYGLAQHPTDTRIWHGGTQDNAEAGTFDGGHDYQALFGGDTGKSLFNRDDPSITYIEAPFGFPFQSTDGGHNYGGVPNCIGPQCLTGDAPIAVSLTNFGGCDPCAPSGCVPDGQAEFITPLSLDPNNADVLYIATIYLYALIHPVTDSIDCSQSPPPPPSRWTRYCAIGDDCPDGSPALTSGDFEDVSALHIAAAGGAACNGGLTSCNWLTGSNAGAIFRSSDGGRSFARVDGLGVTTPARAVMAIETDPANADHVLAAYGGFDADAVQSGAPTGHLYRSLDGGATWTNVAPALPDVPVQTVRVDPFDPGIVYLGTWLGVYRVRGAFDATPVIENVSSNLPNAAVFALDFAPGNRWLRAATFGRGIWELRLGKS